MKILITMAALAGLAVPSLALAQGAVPATATALGEGHARSAMTAYGCASISGLSAGPSGSWHGQCAKGGQTVNVAMDSEGKVTSGTAPTHLTEGHARSAMTAYGCASISGLSAGPSGSWHGQCAKGGQTVNVAMDSEGKVTSGTAPTHITEGHARSALTTYGCATISALYSAPDGAWAGQCYKGGQPVNVMVDNTGKALSR